MIVRQLGYLGLAVRDTAAWQRLLVDRLGCQPAVGSSPERLRFRIDDRSHRIAIQASDAERIDYLGFEVADAAAHTELVERLRAAGHHVVAGTAEELADRQVLGLSHTVDPAGYRVEFYYGPTGDERPFVSALGIPGFVSGALGLGHVVIATPKYEQTLRFYQDQLGFRVSDHITTGGMEAIFLRCNPRHHTVALLRSAPDTEESEFHHFMLEVPDLDSVGRAHDDCVQAEVPISYSLGRHTNDRMVSFYLRTPSGFDIEFGTGGRLVDDATWDVDQYRSISFWGHRPLPTG
ncbi:VOC family protein [Pseudonocardia asaccharolytica]|uniref:Iron-dependent extradiol dioxygenase n=1 Tax=Pseudonocardia asaccharolytica DSM 44247 = NBRC 16224 TaxID=1123024 RepID=A0A511D4R9_9PSEU|nr:VOC family protein [Pseudonocardia asaccharolytica]GEL17928.1 iron-dependent extradiol dioxygenase [Pseudonocardia asaccharolytica DSM 44247 = NBRC 16224]